MTGALRTRPATFKTAKAAQLFHALSDETRLEIVRMLRQGERCVCELTDALDVAQSRLSFHLKTLKEAGLVSDRRDGRWVYYALDAVAFMQMEKAISAFKPLPILRDVDGGCC